MIQEFEMLHHSIYGDCRKGLRNGYIVYALNDVCKAAGLKNTNNYVKNPVLNGELFLDTYEEGFNSMKNIDQKVRSMKSIDLKVNSMENIDQKVRSMENIEQKVRSMKSIDLNHNTTWWVTIDGANILLLRSNKPKAIEVQRWLVKNVLRQIQDTGKYAEGKQADGCFSIQEFADNFFNSNPAKLGQNKVFAILRNNGVLTRNNLPQRKYIENGYMTVQTKISKIGNKSFRTVVTPKGVGPIFQIVKEHYLDEPHTDYNPNQLLINFDNPDNCLTEENYYKSI